MTLFQLCCAPLCFLLTAIHIYHTTWRKISFWKSVFWGSVWALGGVIILWPDVTTYAASFLGIGRGTDLVLYASVLTGLYAFQRLYGRTRRLEDTLTEVVRRDAIHKASFARTDAPGAQR